MGISFLIDEIVLMKWNSFSAFILTHVKKLNFIYFELDGDLPPNFDAFLLQFLQNSQLTLKELYFQESTTIMNMPVISLSNVTRISFQVTGEYQNEISNFDMFMKTIIKNCQYLEGCIIYDVDDCPPIAQYISEYYQEHCVESAYSEASEILPTKMSMFSDLSSLTQGLYLSKIEYLQIQMFDLNFPFEEPWRNYKSILALCPKLKGIAIIMDKNEQWAYLKNVLEDMSAENQDIWKQRISYLKSIGIELMSRKEYKFKLAELSKERKWGFEFWASDN